MAEVIKPALAKEVARRLAAGEYARSLAAFQQLSAAEWKSPTANAGWDVQTMACHVLGMADMAGSPFEARRQIKEATKRSKQTGVMFIDELTGLQVEERADLDPQHLVIQFAKAGPKAAKGRFRAPALIKRRVLPAAQTDGRDPWTLGYLFDVILTRDTWMHRMDLAAAVGHPPELTAEHDGVLVDDAAREWASRHGQPCTLTLTGPAGGSWTFGAGGPEIELDAVEFCRILSGRGEGEGLLKTLVPF